VADTTRIIASRAQRRPVEMVASGDVELAIEDTGGGRPLVLAHGLTATRRYVVHGSRLLERSGFRVVSYDARGHGDSSPAPDPAAYGYDALVRDLEHVLDAKRIDRAVLAGASMGAATSLAFALRSPERVEALVQITPAYAGEASVDVERVQEMDALADALERDGVDGFMREFGEPPVPRRFRTLVTEAVRQRIARHRHPEAVAAALRVVPRSRPFVGVEALERLEMPVLVVGSRDELDPDHPLEVARTYAERIPDAELISEEPGESPLAWRGSRLSWAILKFLQNAGIHP
jgi:pimeloyl-ACP methyl ester carboxylesterase